MSTKTEAANGQDEGHVGESPLETTSKPEERPESVDDRERPSSSKSDSPPSRPSFRKMLLATIGLLLVLEIVARLVLGYRAARADRAFEKLYPPNTYVTSFSAKQDYRSINLFTMNPEKGSGPEYRYDSMGFRLDKRNLHFDAPNRFKRIWMIGSSTTQGGGVRENETIASNLNDILEADGSDWRVYNLGQGGFTSTQELLLFIELLHAGFRPDAILVYDGASDVSFEGDIVKTGAPGWEKHTLGARLLLDVQGGESVSALATLTITRLTKLDDLVAALVRRAPAPAAPVPEGRGGTAYPGDNWDVVARRYLINLNLIRQAADLVGAPSFFYFQPVMQYEDHYGIRKLSDYETETLVPQMANNEYKRREALLSPELESLRTSCGLRDIHDVFRHHDGETLWADPRHPNGKGNAIIAARIYADLREQLVRRSAQ